MSATVTSPRRYFMLKARANDAIGQPIVAAVFRAKALEIVSIALPITYPMRTELIAAHYSTLDDLDGADVAELKAYVGLSTSQATAVIAAIPTIV